MNVQVFWVAKHTAFNVNPHTHDFYHMVFCRKKGGTVTVGNTVYNAQTDYVYFMRPGVLHAMTRGDDMKLIEIKFFIEDSALQNEVSALPDEFTFSDVAFLRSILNQTAKEALSGLAYGSETANCAFKMFLAHAIREFNGSLTNSSIREEAALQPATKLEKVNADVVILNLKSYVEEHLKDEITLTDLANQVFLNPTYFVKRFKILWGVSPMKFVCETRINKAKELLLSTNLSASSIAEECGFNSLHYFSRCFKQQEGISPTEYIAMHKI